MGHCSHHRLIVLAPVLALAVSACGGSASTEPPPVDRSGLQAVVVSTSAWVGETSLLVALTEPDATPVALAGRTVTASLVEPGGASTPAKPPVLAGRVVRAPGGSRDLVVFDTAPSVAGRWTLELVLESANSSGVGQPRRATTEFTVREPGPVPTRGDAAPSTVTPTLDSVGDDLALLTTDAHPRREFYERSVDQALADGLPFMLVLDSASFRESEACGGALAILHGLAGRFPSVAIIHAEPFETRVVAGQLALDPPGGPARLARWSLDWGLGDPAFGAASLPWVFAVGRDGTVRDAFQGVMGSEELAQALTAVAD